jgi:hypothetical protein
MLASFNYNPPSTKMILMGIIAGVVVLLVVGYLGKVRTGIGVGAVAGLLIAWFVIGSGVGDLTGFTQLIWSPAYALLGGILGGAAAGLGMAYRIRQDQRKSRKKRKRPPEIVDPF